MKKNLLTSIVIAGALTGCDSAKNTLGISHYQPDEFNVSDNPPLTLPKDYNLRAPVAGATTTTPNGETQEKASDKASKKTLPKKAKKAKKTHTDDAVVKKAKSDAAIDENIRDKVNAEEESDNVLEQKLSEIKKNAASLGESKTKTAEKTEAKTEVEAEKATAEYK